MEHVGNEWNEWKMMKLQIWGKFAPADVHEQTCAPKSFKKSNVFFSSNLPLCGSIRVNNGGGSAHPENTIYIYINYRRLDIFSSIPSEIPKSFPLP